MFIETTIYTGTIQKVTVGFDTEDKDTVRMTTAEMDSNDIFVTYLTKEEARELAAVLLHYSK